MKCRTALIISVISSNAVRMKLIVQVNTTSPQYLTLGDISQQLGLKYEWGLDYHKKAKHWSQKYYLEQQLPFSTLVFAVSEASLASLEVVGTLEVSVGWLPSKRSSNSKASSLVFSAILSLKCFLTFNRRKISSLVLCNRKNCHAAKTKINSVPVY